MLFWDLRNQTEPSPSCHMTMHQKVSSIISTACPSMFQSNERTLGVALFGHMMFMDGKVLAEVLKWWIC